MFNIQYDLFSILIMNIENYFFQNKKFYVFHIYVIGNIISKLYVRMEYIKISWFLQFIMVEILSKISIVQIWKSKEKLVNYITLLNQFTLIYLDSHTVKCQIYFLTIFRNFIHFAKWSKKIFLLHFGQKSGFEKTSS